jgi:hypothetical protein
VRLRGQYNDPVQEGYFDTKENLKWSEDYLRRTGLKVTGRLYRLESMDTLGLRDWQWIFEPFLSGRALYSYICHLLMLF